MPRAAFPSASLLSPLRGAITQRNATGWARQALSRNFASRAQPTPRPRISTTAARVSHRRSATRPVAASNKCVSAPRRPFHNTSRLRDPKSSPKPDPKPDPQPASKQEPQSLSARLRKLSREYGWAALGVYLALSVADFPFCFLLVRIVGTERIGQLEHFLVSNIKKFIPESLRDKWHEYRKALKEAEVENLGNDELSEHVEMAGWGVKEAEERNKSEASLGTQLALAYAIHKSFIFVRVPLTAAVTPKVVKVLRSWGWNIGKRRNKP
ncbi:hypothetical protein GGR56DRAFT_590381 [Xylariaceae sp. FL0804]|nr:hypothetical protein GGR56DRAFT_590381 [Xylariaceae sp. FL0804]